MTATQEFKNFSEFYPYYLAEHSQRWNRVLHLAGFLIFVPLNLWAAYRYRNPLFVLSAVACVYLVGWIGHFMVEHNKPTTGRYPRWSFLSYFRMIFGLVTGQVPFDGRRG